MAFNDTLPLQINDLEKRSRTNERKIVDLNFSLAAERHECNCEFCDYEDPYESVNEDEIEKQIDEIKEENILLAETVRKLRLYAKDHEIEIKEASGGTTPPKRT